MASARGPPKSGITPSRYPELALEERWNEMYTELLEAGNTRHASMKAIADEFRTTTTTVKRYVDPEYKKKQARQRRGQWRKDGSAYEAKKSANTKRVRARRNIESILEEAYDRVDHAPVDIRELAHLVEEVCGLVFRPKTILNLSHRHKETTGKGLLQEVYDAGITKYVVR